LTFYQRSVKLLLAGLFRLAIFFGGNMASISLAKAMKIKNRLAGRLTKVQTSISTYNSVLVDRAGEVDVAELDKTRAQIVSALVTLKTAIAAASTGVQKVIYLLSEKKAEITFLSCLETKNGREPAYGLRSEPQNFVATIKIQDVTDRVKALEFEIDELQDKLDAYNAVPDRVYIDTSILALAS
jgi:hypothetical protein